MASIGENFQGPRSYGPVLTALCLALGIGITGCANSSDNVAARTPGTAAATVAGKPIDPSGAGIPPKSKLPKLPKGVSTAKPNDPLAMAAIGPVKRNGKKVQPGVRTKRDVQPFTTPVTYTDGLGLRIAKMTQGKVSGQGPGVFPGRTVTDFYLTLANHTKKALPLDVVVVTVTYGSPARLAHLVYNPNSVDFTGPLAAGQSAKAVYGFSIPTADLGNVTMTVDLDGVHQLAVFKGKVT